MAPEAIIDNWRIIYESRVSDELYRLNTLKIVLDNTNEDFARSRSDPTIYQVSHLIVDDEEQLPKFDAT